ncbi:hypothetical protein HYV88_04135 [Candidatus Woesearchaeota archaeon]|nr:hypothetical protein [Candidatus Woesearchaeota archaeon]
MQSNRSLTAIYFFSIILFTIFSFYAYFSNVKDYINDSIIAIILVSIVFFLKKHINLYNYSFILLILGLVSHLSGVFGFYSSSPLLIQYDHFTHFLGLFAVSVIFFNFFKKFFSENKINNFLILIVIFLTSLGIGSLIEETEFLGFLKFGTGEGLLKFGGLGDTPSNEGMLRDIDVLGGGWINTMWDLVYNSLGALFGVIFMYIVYIYKRKIIRN